MIRCICVKRESCILSVEVENNMRTKCAIPIDNATKEVREAYLLLAVLRGSAIGFLSAPESLRAPSLSDFSV